MYKPLVYALVLTTAAVLAFTGCEQIIDLELEDGRPTLVVEGLLTDQEGPHYVILSESNPNFYDTLRPRSVRNAMVRISDDAGNSEELTYVGGGRYETRTLETAIGRKYDLYIEWRGDEYRSRGELAELGTFDSLVWQFDEDREQYQAFMYAAIIDDSVNYYRMLVYRNDTLFDDEDDFFIAGDDAISYNLFNVEVPYFHDFGDTVRVELQRLDKPMYNYYLTYLDLLFSDGGIFTSIPENPFTNVQNINRRSREPLGLFQVSTVLQQEIVMGQ